MPIFRLNATCFAGRYIKQLNGAFRKLAHELLALRLPVGALIQNDEVITANAKNVSEFKAGNEKALNALVGQIMKASKGKANPQQVNDLLRSKLA